MEVNAATVGDDERLRIRQPPPDAPVMRQLWRRLGFIHWPVAAGALAPLLPGGLEVDLFEGQAYVGLVPFTVPRSRLPGVGVPLMPPFHELNLRTYVHRSGCNPGVWFFSLDAASRLAVLGARTFYGLPYFHARMRLTERPAPDGPMFEYVSWRRRTRSGRGNAEFRGHYGPVGPVAPARPGSLEFFLLERYLLYAWNGHALSTARVWHAPYPVQRATAHFEQTVTDAAGIVVPPAPPLVHYAAEVDVRIHRPRRADDAVVSNMAP